MKPSGPGKPPEFQVDPRVRKVLAEWGRERGSEPGLLELGRQYQRLSPEQQEQLIHRMAEISLGLLFVIGQAKGPRGTP